MVAVGRVVVNLELSPDMQTAVRAIVRDELAKIAQREAYEDGYGWTPTLYTNGDPPPVA